MIRDPRLVDISTWGALIKYSKLNLYSTKWALQIDCITANQLPQQVLGSFTLFHDVIDPHVLLILAPDNFQTQLPSLHLCNYCPVQYFIICLPQQQPSQWFRYFVHLQRFLHITMSFKRQLSILYPPVSPELPKDQR